MITKQVGFAYPTSPDAVKFGFAKSGCYSVSLGGTDPLTPPKSIAAFLTKREAFEYANKMPEPFGRYSIVA